MADPPAMSRAFVKETDVDPAADLPDRQISPHPNLVTEEGMALIDAELEQLQRALLEVGEDLSARARIERDLRYWRSRRASAEVVPPPEDNDVVRFGAAVTIVRDDDVEKTYRIVGEDEADPAKGSVSYVSPLARALMGKGEGDTATVAGREVEIITIR